MYDYMFGRSNSSLYLSFYTLQSLRKNILQHLQQYALYHAQIQAEFFSKLKEESEKTTCAAQNLIERVASLEQRFSLAERQLDSYEQRFEVQGGESRERKPEQYSSKISSLEQQLTQIQRRIEEVSVGYTASSGYGIDVRTGVLGASARYSGATPQQFETLSAKVTELNHSLDRCLSSSLDQELRLQLLERATYNGILLWKIDDFNRRRREAVDGVTPSLYSTPFYTSQHGYKMCARVYLNGDGLGKGTHLSFFFVILRGPFDALLVWPFKQKVTLTLINQAGKKHVTDSFCPDPHSSSFQRPGRKEMNIASGYPMFIRVEHVLNGGFIKDDCIFLKIAGIATDAHDAQCNASTSEVNPHLKFKICHSFYKR